MLHKIKRVIWVTNLVVAGESKEYGTNVLVKARKM